MGQGFLNKAGVIVRRALVGMLLLAGILTWLLGTEFALRWSAQQAEQLNNGRLVLHGVHGSLYGPLRIEKLSFQTGQQRFELKELDLDWTPISLLRGHIHVRQLAVQELSVVDRRPSAEASRLPETLSLPVTFSVPSITVGRILIKSGEAEQVLSGIGLGLEKLADSYSLDLRAFAGAWGKGSAHVSLGDTRPFTVLAQARLQQTEGVAYDAEADVSGDLSQLLLHARASTLGGQAELDATLNPFEEFPLTKVRLTAAKMNPALLGKGSPLADLSAVVSLERQGAARLEGNLLLRNGFPGSWNQARLPLREISARFSGSPGQLALRAVRLDLAGAGEFNGGGQIENGLLQLNLSTAAFNPRGVLDNLRAMRLAGDIRLQAAIKSQRLTADLGDRRFRLHLDALHQDAALELREATVRAGRGNLSLHGSLSLEGLRKFNLAGALQGFNPGDFGDYPAARINAAFSATGQLATTFQGALGFAIADSQFRQQPLSGKGTLNVSATHIWNADLKLRLAGNRLAASGALGNPGDRLSVEIGAENLGAFDPNLGGKVNAKGALAGSFSAPSGNVEAQILNLSWRGHYRVASLAASGRLDQGADGRLVLDASLQGLDAPQLRLDRAALSAQGTRLNHTLQFQAKNRDFDLRSQLAGGWQDTLGWSGQVMDLVNRGRDKFQLKSPAKLKIANRRFRLENARFDFADADLVLHDLEYAAGQATSRGEFTRLPLAAVLRVGPLASPQGLPDDLPDLKTDLTLGGRWQVTMRDSINGQVALWRESGDVTISEDPKTTLGLSRLSLSVDAVNSRFESRMEAIGTNLGSVRADAVGAFSMRNGAWGIAGDAPLRASADLAVESLAWIQPFLDQADRPVFDGAIKAKLRAAGTFAQPQLTGGISGERFTLGLPDQGLLLTEGRFQADLGDRVLHLRDLSIRGGDGILSGQGQLTLEGGSPGAQLSLKADRLELSSRPDRHLVLSGTSEASVVGTATRITAKLKADRGLIELPKEDAPVSSDDVVVLGRTKTIDRRHSPYVPSFGLDLDLGEHFFVKGKGLDAQLAGALTVAGEAGARPTSRGSIRVEKGSYAAYGQRLEIERGILNFQGPLDNPGLNIIALRKNQPVEAGVAVTGTAQLPRVSLVSNPNVPDSQKLSWLVLGHAIDDSSKQEFNALQAAAGALLATGESVKLQQKLAHAAGFDEVSLRGTGGLESTVLTLGKRLSSRAYLSYEQGLAGAGILVKINYALSKRLSLRAQAGASPGVDLFYTFSFN